MSNRAKSLVKHAGASPRLQRRSSTRTQRSDDLRRTLVESARIAGGILLGYFGRITNPRRKGSTSSIVCDADLAAEEAILKILRRRFPADAIIAEETGFVPGSSGFTWVIDPLDGTSNFVAGLPWFGVQLGLLKGTQPLAAVMFLPLSADCYYSERGGGAFKNRTRIKVSPEPDPANVLCAFGFDPDPHIRIQKSQIELLMRVSKGVRNTRTTNSLVDFCYTAEGKLGGCINLCTKIWDIVPVSTVLPEAGGLFSDLSGKQVVFDLSATGFDRSYAVLGASRKLHSRFVAMAAAPGQGKPLAG